MRRSGSALNRGGMCADGVNGRRRLDTGPPRYAQHPPGPACTRPGLHPDYDEQSHLYLSLQASTFSHAMMLFKSLSLPLSFSLSLSLSLSLSRPPCLPHSLRASLSQEIKAGPHVLELYKKPTDLKRKKLSLLTVKPLYLHITIELAKSYLCLSRPQGIYCSASHQSATKAIQSAHTDTLCAHWVQSGTPNV